MLSGFLPVSGLPEHPCWETQKQHRTLVLSTDIQIYLMSLNIFNVFLCLLYEEFVSPKCCLLGHATRKLGMGREFRVSHTPGQSSENHPFQISINRSPFEVRPDFELLYWDNISWSFLDDTQCRMCLSQYARGKKAYLFNSGNIDTCVYNCLIQTSLLDKSMAMTFP